MKDMQTTRTLKIPERFWGYRIAMVDMPGRPEYDMIFDMTTRTIWVNSAAVEDANVVYLDFPRNKNNSRP